MLQRKLQRYHQAGVLDSDRPGLRCAAGLVPPPGALIE